MVSNKLLKLTFIYIFLILLGFNASAYKENKVKYIIYFDNPKLSDVDCYQPELFLSDASIRRRKKQNIFINEEDLPLSKIYIKNLQAINAKILGTSKWLNAVAIEIQDKKDIEKKLMALPYVCSVVYAGNISNSYNNLKESKVAHEKEPQISTQNNYGYALPQLTQCNGLYLHEKGFKGKGINIAVLDGGFLGVDSMSCFDYLRSSGKIIDTKNFVNNNKDVYNSSDHGTKVLSIMAANIPDYYVGTAPDANYWLLKTENTITEELMEEFFFIMALEYADSAGVDIINASIGYNYFDDERTSHTWDELDGQQVMVTQAVNIAFKKGILVVVSAGNEGNAKWKYLSFPADASGALTVAATDINNKVAKFSSKGFIKENYVKPNVAALGYKIPMLGIKENIEDGYGTSFATPLISGLAACLWEAYYEASSLNIKQSIETSSSNYLAPNAKMGYGVPDFASAYKILEENISSSRINESINIEWHKDDMSLNIFLKKKYKKITIFIENPIQKKSFYYDYYLNGTQYLYINKPEFSQFKSGLYFININADNNNLYYKIML
jgi:subtilisin family serine protease